MLEFIPDNKMVIHYSDGENKTKKIVDIVKEMVVGGKTIGYQCKLQYVLLDIKVMKEGYVIRAYDTRERNEANENMSLTEMGWFDKEGRLHRENGPALSLADGSSIWFTHGKRHKSNEVTSK